MPTVFLSYAHDDNAVVDKKDKGWVTFFDLHLNIVLKERGLVDVKLYRDTRDLNPMNIIRDKLAEEVKGSDILLAVLSPLYVQKDYTLFELDGFIAHKSPSGASGAAQVILLVLKRTLPDSEFPPSIRHMGYVPFFELDREKNIDVLFYQGYGRVILDKYWDSMERVAALIEESLPRAAAARATDPSAGTSMSAPTVYLAESTLDVGNEQWSLRKELDAQGCPILPKDPWPAGIGEARQHLFRSLDEAAFSIHLLGATSGTDAASGLSTLSKLQLDLAAEHAKTKPGFRRLIWVSPSLQPADDHQRELIQDLEDGASLLPTDELVRNGFGNFKEIVLSELKRHGGTTLLGSTR